MGDVDSDSDAEKRDIRDAESMQDARTVDAGAVAVSEVKSVPKSKRTMGRPAGSKDSKPRKRPTGSVGPAVKVKAALDNGSARKLFEDAGDGDEESGVNKRQRSELRQLQSTPRVGLRKCALGLLDGLPLPWTMQAHVLDADKMLHLTRDESRGDGLRLAHMPVDGPFNDRDAWKYMSSKREQLLFAQEFAVPLRTEWVPLLDADDIVGVEAEEADAVIDFVCERDATSAVLFAASRMHEGTRLDWSRTPHVARTVVRQFGKNHTANVELNGVDGGPAGCKRHVFHFLTTEDHLSITPEPLLELTSLLCAILNNGNSSAFGIDLHPGINTEYTELSVRTRSHTVTSVRTQDPFDLDIAQQHSAIGVADEIDPGILLPVQAFRAQTLEKSFLEEEECVPSSRKINDSDKAGRALPARAEMPKQSVDTELFQISLGVTVLRAVDLDGKMRRLKLNTLTVKERVVGIDFCVALKQALESNATKALLLPVLLAVLRHMFNNFHANPVFDMGNVLSGRLTQHHLVSALCEDRVALAVLSFARVHRMQLVNYEGMLLRPQKHSQYQIIERNCQFATSARFNAFLYIIQLVEMQDLNSHSSAMDRKLPSTDLRLDGAVSFHWRSVPLQALQLLIHHHKQSKQEEKLEKEDGYDERWEEDFDAEMNRFQNEQLQDNTQDGSVYFAVEGALRNTGLELVLNMQMVSIDLSSNGLKKKSSVSVKPLAQPTRLVECVRIYLSNAACDADPYRCLLATDSEEGGVVVCDRDFLCMTKRLQGQLYDLREALTPLTGQERTATKLETLYEEELMMLLGKNQHPITGKMKSLSQTVALAEVVGVTRGAFRHALHETLEIMRTADLLQWKWAARVVLDLRSQGKRYAGDYLWDGQASWKRGATAYDDGANVSRWLEEQRREADLRLSWMPHMLIEVINTGVMSMFSKTVTDAAYGQTLKIVNCGQAVRVLVTSRDSAGTFARDRRVELMYDKKDSSCGADMMHAKEAEMNVVYNIFCVDDLDIKQFYQSEEAKEVSTKHLTAGKATTWLGCGFKRDGDGHFSEGGGEWMRQVGLCGVTTETNKLTAGSDTAKNFAAIQESSFNHSGTSCFVKEVGMETHMQGVAQSTHRVLPMPCKVTCGNRHDPGEPDSLIKGGRFRVGNSPTRDGRRGVLVLDTPLVVGQFQAVIGAEDENAEPVAPTAVHVAIRGQQIGKLVQGQVGNMTEAKTKRMRGKALFDALKRRCLIFTHRSMSLGFLETPYTLGFDFQTIETDIGRLMRGVMRFYLADAETWQRTGGGPFQTATALPVFMQQTTARCLLMASTRARQSVDIGLSYEDNQRHAGLEGVDLYMAFEEMLLTFVQTPVTVVSTLSALYLWLSQTVLDVSVMLVTCYALTMIGFSAPCPLLVLAKACNGVELQGEDLRRYMDFCDFMVPLVVEEAAPSANAAPLHATLLDEAALKPVTDEILHDWFNPTSEWTLTNHAFRTRTGVLKSTPSPYVRASLRTVDRELPSWFETADGQPQPKRKKGVHAPADEFVTATPRLKLAQSFARQQTEDLAEERCKNREAQGFQHPGRFWAAAREGTRFPKWNKTSKDMRHDMKFDDPETTGHFWESTFESLQGCDGPLVSFLALCGCAINASRHDFFSRLFVQYGRRRGVGKIKVRTDGSWKVPIMHSKDGEVRARRPAFEWGSWPSFKQQGYGGELKDGVETVLGIDVMHIVIGQMYCSEWQANGGRIQAVVHLRNLGYAAEELLSLYIHTAVELAVLPKNEVVLQVPCPSGFSEGRRGGRAVHLPVAAEIHSDRTIFRDNVQGPEIRSPLNVLRHNSRRPEHFRRVTFGVGDAAVGVFYRAVLGATGGAVPDSWSDLFPFPPEAVGHMPTHFLKLREWTQAYRREFPERTGDRLTDMGSVIQEVGKSVGSGTLGVVPLTLTNGVGRELPCVTFKGSYLFVAVERDDGRFDVKPVESTSPGDDMMAMVWRPLMVQDGVSMVLDAIELHLAMVDGFWFDPASGQVVGKEHAWWEQTSCRKLWRLTFMPFPILSWDQAVLLDVAGRTLDTDHGPMRVVSAQSEYEHFELRSVDADSDHARVLAACGVDVAALVSAGCKIEIMELGVSENGEFDTETSCVWVTLPDGGRLYFAGVPALRAAIHAAPENDLQKHPFALRRVHAEWLVARDMVFDSANPSGYHLYPILKGEGLHKGRLVIEMVDYDGEKYNTQQQQKRNIELRIQSQKTYLDSNTTIVQKLEDNSEKPEYNDRLIEARKLVERAETVLASSEEQLHELCLSIEQAPIMPRMSETRVVAAESSEADLALSVSLHPASTTASPEEVRDYRIGMIKAWPDGSYLVNGHYRVCAAIPGQSLDELQDAEGALDFLSVSRCLLPECSSLIVNLTPHIYRQLRSVHPELRVPDLETHRLLDGAGSIPAANLDHFEEIPPIPLRVRYILGSTPKTIAADSPEAVLRVILLVQSRRPGEDTFDFTDDPATDNVALYVRILTPTATAVADLLRVEDAEDSSHAVPWLYRDSKMRLPSRAHADVADGQGDLWGAHAKE